MRKSNLSFANPINVLLIPDGNRRAARSAGLSYKEAYKLATKVAYESVLFFLSRPFVKTYGIFGLSYDNLSRLGEDLAPILEAQEKLYHYLADNHVFSKRGIKVNFVGELELTPPKYQEAARKLEKETADGNKQFYALIGYDGQREITRALRRARWAKRVNLDEKEIFEFLDIKHPIDLIIRTGGEKRISGAPLYQSKYAEFVVVEQYFPFCGENEWRKALNDFNNRQRRFGR
jgi:undecaprenyl diphosphate synthase